MDGIEIRTDNAMSDIESYGRKPNAIASGIVLLRPSLNQSDRLLRTSKVLLEAHASPATFSNRQVNISDVIGGLALFSKTTSRRICRSQHFLSTRHVMWKGSSGIDRSLAEQPFLK